MFEDEQAGVLLVAGDHIDRRAQSRQHRRVRATVRIDLLDDGGAGRKREPTEQRDEQLALELPYPRRHGLENGCTDAGGVRNRIERRERSESTGMDVSLPHKVASSVSDVELVADELDVKKVRPPDVVRRGGQRVGDLDMQRAGAAGAEDVGERFPASLCVNALLVGYILGTHMTLLTARAETIRFAALALCLLSMPVMARAQPLTLEQTAQEIARQHNANAKALIDDTTVSTSATAEGVNVIVTYVLRIRQQLPEDKRDEFRKGIATELMRGICRSNADKEAFKQGLYYTLVYRNTEDELLSKLVVSRETCSKLE